MPGSLSLYQEIVAQIKEATRGQGLRHTTVVRLALLVTGMIAARSCVLRRIASELWSLELTGANCAEHIGRRLRRTLNDAQVLTSRCYQPAVSAMLDWQTLRETDGRIVLALDESSQGPHLHLLRLCLTYRGSGVPLTWALWPQNQRLDEGAYWQAVDAVLTAAAQLLPLGIPVVLLADRAYDVPALIDRLTELGWSWVIRVKAHGTLRVRDRLGREQAIAALVARHVGQPGRRWKGRAQVFKKAGWREASLVALWGRGETELLAVLTDQPPAWHVLAWYRRRSWIEPSFRNDKRRGWEWEACQVREQEHQERLLVAMAWASLILLCLGVAEAEQRLAQRIERAQQLSPSARRAHPRDSLFLLGLEQARRWLYRGAPRPPVWRIPKLDAPSWTDEWWQAACWRPTAQSVRP
jgi:hypothetical protein